VTPSILPLDLKEGHCDDGGCNFLLPFLSPLVMCCLCHFLVLSPSLLIALKLQVFSMCFGGAQEQRFVKHDAFPLFMWHFPYVLVLLKNEGVSNMMPFPLFVLHCCCVFVLELVLEQSHVKCDAYPSSICHGFLPCVHVAQGWHCVECNACPSFAHVAFCVCVCVAQE
jgi:hypothetical protein